MFKEHIARAKTPMERRYFQEQRKKHLGLIFTERTLYKRRKEHAKRNPQTHLSMIVDGMTAHATEGPTTPTCLDQLPCHQDVMHVHNNFMDV